MNNETSLIIPDVLSFNGI